jgi:hypothetical protein
MPAEAARLRRGAPRRDLRIGAILLCACALALLVGAARAQGGAPPAGTRCVRADVPGVLGGGTVRGCGRRAAAVCTAYAPMSASLAGQCARLRRRVRPAPRRAGTTPASAGPAAAGGQSSM